MKPGKYLQDVLDISTFIPDTFNLIIAPCGSGKTTAAINTIAALASSPRKALFLIDTQNGNLRLAQNEALTLPYVFFAKSAGCDLTWGELPPAKIVVSTYA
jgi:superfamily II DNA or RNA helicase